MLPRSVPPPDPQSRFPPHPDSSLPMRSADHSGGCGSSGNWPFLKMSRTVKRFKQSDQNAAPSKRAATIQSIDPCAPVGLGVNRKRPMSKDTFDNCPELLPSGPLSLEDLPHPSQLCSSKRGKENIAYRRRNSFENNLIELRRKAAQHGLSIHLSGPAPACRNLMPQSSTVPPSHGGQFGNGTQMNHHHTPYISTAAYSSEPHLFLNDPTPTLAEIHSPNVTRFNSRYSASKVTVPMTDFNVPSTTFPLTTYSDYTCRSKASRMDNSFASFPASRFHSSPPPVRANPTPRMIRDDADAERSFFATSSSGARPEKMSDAPQPATDGSWHFPPPGMPWKRLEVTTVRCELMGTGDERRLVEYKEGRLAAEDKNSAVDLSNVFDSYEKSKIPERYSQAQNLQPEPLNRSGNDAVSDEDGENSRRVTRLWHPRFISSSCHLDVENDGPDPETSSYHRHEGPRSEFDRCFSRHGDGDLSPETFVHPFDRMHSFGARIPSPEVEATENIRNADSQSPDSFRKTNWQDFVDYEE